VHKITPFLWFNDNAEEAANFYVSVFPDSRIVAIVRYGEAGAAASGIPKGMAMTVALEIGGQGFIAMNGRPYFAVLPALWFVVNCGTQEELDELWQKLSQGGEPGECGWVKDKYGVSWQIVPAVLGEMLSDRDVAKSVRVMQAMLKMRKLDIPTLERAYQHA
jgi:predicted 3-demethylubiquinone-9 3-methyltransferase (glyoxalase superfamily)